MAGTSGSGIDALKAWVKSYVSDTLSSQAGGGY